MPRTARHAPGGMLFHVLNRGVGRMRLLLKDDDFQAFERFLQRTLETRPMRIVAYCLMPNHWHLVLWPKRDGDLAAIRRSVQRGQPYGDAAWVRATAQRLGAFATFLRLTPAHPGPFTCLVKPQVDAADQEAESLSAFVWVALADGVIRRLPSYLHCRRPDTHEG